MATQSTTASAITDTATKGGYGYDFVSPPPKSLECPICLLTLRDPHVISCCGNEFCQVCIDRVKRDGKRCPLCNEQKFSTMLHKKLVREVNALVVRCPQKELGCEWEGELSQVQNHLYPRADDPELGLRSTVKPMGCHYVTVACTYKCGAELQRGLLAKHERDACLKRPIEMQVASLTHKYENILVSNQLLRKELDEVKRSHESEIKQMQLQHQQELEDVKKKYCDILEHSKSLEQEMMKAIDIVIQNVQQEEGLKEKVKADSCEVRKEMEKLVQQKSQSLSLHTMPLPVPPFYFTLNNIEHYMENNFCWYSDPFYSHPGGYKMTIAVYPNGRSTGLETHLSIFVNIIRGEFDDRLEWPCNLEVSIEAWKQRTYQWTNRQRISVSPRSTTYYYDAGCAQKPTNSRRNSGIGVPMYIDHYKLPDYYTTHIRGDAVEFRVVDVTINHK